MIKNNEEVIDSITETEIVTEKREQEMERMKMIGEKEEGSAIISQMSIMIEVIMIIRKEIELAEVIILLTQGNMRNMSRVIHGETKVMVNIYVM